MKTGTPLHILFVCSQNKLRSPTAEAIFADVDGVMAMSAGTNHDAETPLSADLIDWADLIVAMEKTHRSKVQKRFAKEMRAKRMTVLGILDDYDFMDPGLIELIKGKFPRWFAA